MTRLFQQPITLFYLPSSKTSNSPCRQQVQNSLRISWPSESDSKRKSRKTSLPPLPAQTKRVPKTSVKESPAQSYHNPLHQRQQAQHYHNPQDLPCHHQSPSLKSFNPSPDLLDLSLALPHHQLPSMNDQRHLQTRIQTLTTMTSVPLYPQPPTRIHLPTTMDPRYHNRKQLPQEPSATNG